jgi:signal transduction histidine kinase
LKSLLQNLQNIILPSLVILLVVVGWYIVIQQIQALTQATITAYQQTELEIVRTVARSVKSYVADQVERHRQANITELEQTIFTDFVAPIRLLENGDAWIYAPDHVVFDLSSDFPDLYRNKSMAEIFALQVKAGASHYEEMTEAVMNAQEGVGWYIWLPEKGKEIAAWTPVSVGRYIWTIGLSTPLPEILESTGAAAQIRISVTLMALATLISLGLLIAWTRSTIKRSRAEQALQRAHAELERRVEERTAALSEMNLQLLEANRLKTELLAKVSHELRTPLSTILGFAELLELGVYGLLTEEQRNLIAKIINSTQYQTGLINELLDQAQLEAGKLKLNLAPFAPADIVDKVQSEMSVLAQAKGLTLTSYIAADIPANLSGDPMRLQQILINLVSNAIKFTEQGEIRVRLCRPDDHHWAIQVSDTGPGIPIEAQSHVFEPFGQVDGSMTRTHRGIGLGLSIVKQLTVLMGGQVALESEIGRGSTFTVRLPLVNA